MTDKQIIDEERMFECVWCKYGFKESDANFILSENPNECVCSGCITEWADNLLCDFKRKEQECEELKDKLNCCFCNPIMGLDDIENFKKCVETTECFRRRLDKLKQTLAEIKEIAEKAREDLYTCESIGYADDDLRSILKKINEVTDK